MRPGAQTVLRLGHASTPSFVRPVAAKPGAAPRVRINVTYAGFSPAARTAFQRAIDLWEPLLNSTVPINVRASFAPLGGNILGSAGPNFVWRNFAGAPRRNTWYPDAIANKRAGRQIDPSPDIIAQFSSNFSDWSFAAGPALAGKIDFTSVVMHELGHGLGFLGAGTVSGGQGSVRLNSSPRLPLIYDRFTENQAGQALLSFPDQSAQLANQLTGGQIYFDSPQVRAAAGGRARLHAPSPWVQGSSYSHLAEGTYRQGNPNSLMTPIINYGETIRSPGAITRAIFRTTGW
jgi:hypothetical protein